MEEKKKTVARLLREALGANDNRASSVAGPTMVFNAPISITFNAPVRVRLSRKKAACPWHRPACQPEGERNHRSPVSDEIL